MGASGLQGMNTSSHAGIKNGACNARPILFVFDLNMKLKIFSAMAVIAAVIVTAGCVSTVNDNQTAGIYTPDSVVARYQRPFDDVYNASVQVVSHEGILINENMRHDTTNTVRSLEGKINGDKVYVEVEAVDPQITQVTVQARTGLVGDRQEAHEVDKEIALQLARQ